MIVKAGISLVLPEWSIVLEACLWLPTQLQGLGRHPPEASPLPPSLKGATGIIF